MMADHVKKPPLCLLFPLFELKIHHHSPPECPNLWQKIERRHSHTQTHTHANTVTLFPLWDTAKIWLYFNIGRTEGDCCAVQICVPCLWSLDEYRVCVFYPIQIWKVYSECLFCFSLYVSVHCISLFFKSLFFTLPEFSETKQKKLSWWRTELYFLLENVSRLFYSTEKKCTDGKINKKGKRWNAAVFPCNKLKYFN